MIKTAKQLAERLAELAKNIRDAILALMESESEKGKLRQLHKAFRATLLHDLTEKGFADAYAQTIAYGLLAVAITRPDKTDALSQERLHDLAPIANPFLRKMLTAFLHANGKSGKLNFDELGVQSIIELLSSKQTDLPAVLRDFGRRKQDPALHFYEDFLRYYDPKTKFARGVFYTPKPVVKYIVRNIHESLQNDFGLEDGLASKITWGEMIAKNPKIQLPSTTKPEEHFVRILDPATGTATFLVYIIEWIYNHLTAKWTAEGKTEAEQKEEWQNYVPKHLLPRIYGYEIMMAPYAVAHMKISLKLQETGYSFTGKEGRVHVYLTNALEPPMEQFKLPDFEPLAEEAGAVNEVKKKTRFSVLTGNPPYSVKSQNKGEWITRQIRDHYYPNDEIKERNTKVISDDYVKFLRFSQYSLTATGIGLFGHITNHSWIDNPTFRRMRQSLLETFSRISVLDLHGNTRKKETAPDGSKDENVFDIQQGVAITIASKSSAVQKQIQHAEFYGLRQSKETALDKPDNPAHSQPKPNKPFYLIIPQDAELTAEYDCCWKTPKVMLVYTSGIKTHRDALVIDFDEQTLRDRIAKLRSNLPDETIAAEFRLRDTGWWNISNARRQLHNDSDWEKHFQRILYRPLDWRYIYYHSALVDGYRGDVMRHMLGGKNVALIACRQFAGRIFFTANCTNTLTEISSQPYAPLNLFPLYLYFGEGEMMGEGILAGEKREKSAPKRMEKKEMRRKPNFSAEFLAALAKAMDVPQSGEFGLPSGVSPEDIFGYIYSILHSPAYRRRYRDFLRIDFPRIPLPKSLAFFRELSALGSELVSLHLLTHPDLENPAVQHFGKNRRVEKVGWTKENGGRIWLDGKGNRANFSRGTSGFAPVSEEVWRHHIGGYQVCEKWLKDRISKKSEPPRILSDDDILHFRRIVSSIEITIQTMNKVDKSILSHGNFPNAFISG